MLKLKDLSISDAVAQTSPLVAKLKEKGDLLLTKLAESAGTEMGKWLAPRAAFLLTVAVNLQDLLDKVTHWIRILTNP